MGSPLRLTSVGHRTPARGRPRGLGDRRRRVRGGRAGDVAVPRDERADRAQPGRRERRGRSTVAPACAARWSPRTGPHRADRRPVRSRASSATSTGSATRARRCRTPVRRTDAVRRDRPPRSSGVCGRDGVCLAAPGRPRRHRQGPGAALGRRASSTATGVARLPARGRRRPRRPRAATRGRPVARRHRGPDRRRATTSRSSPSRTGPSRRRRSGSTAGPSTAGPSTTCSTRGPASRPTAACWR